MRQTGQDLAARFTAIIRDDPGLMRLLAVLRHLDLPQWRLVSGCLYQTVWNELTGRPRGTGIKDYDLAYFDEQNLSWAAEDAVIRRVAAATTGCVGPVETRNQARVHLWFEERFGAAYPRLGSADESLRYYAAVAHAVGVRLDRDDRLDIAAPFGLDDVFAMVVRPSHALDNAGAYAEKAARMRAIWPELRILPWAISDTPDTIRAP